MGFPHLTLIRLVLFDESYMPSTTNNYYCHVGRASFVKPVNPVNAKPPGDREALSVKGHRDKHVQFLLKLPAALLD